MLSLNRSYTIATLAVISGVAAIVGAYLFLLTIPEPPAGSDGFAYGLAGGGAMLYGLSGLVVVADGVTMAGIEAFDAGTPHHRLAAQIGTVLAGAGPLPVFVWVHLDGPVELLGVAVVCIAVGTLFVGLVSGWVGATSALRTLRSGETN